MELANVFCKFIKVKMSTFSNFNTDYAGDVSAQEAWQILATDPSSQLIDVRSDAEWNFVGYPDLTPIGKKLIRLSWKLYPQMMMNSAFLNSLQDTIENRNAKLFFICKTGGRSRESAIATTAVGYKHCYNISDGFEGPQDQHKHRGLIKGWKAAGLPWEQN
jgi:rhodanese-related sulfurtransferase